MRIAVPDLVSNSLFPALAAVELGCFKAEGLEMELDLRAGAKAWESLRDGQCDFVASAAHAPLSVFPRWEGAKLLAALAQYAYWFLVLRADLGCRRGDIQAVRGLRIGADPAPGLVLRVVLALAGIDPQRDQVEIVPVSGAGQPGVSFGVLAAEALAEGQIDGFWANGMGAEVSVRRGTGMVLLDVRRGDGPPGARDLTFPALITTDRLIAREPEVVAAAVRAIVRAQAVLREDPSHATATATQFFPPLETSLIAELVRRDAPYYDAAIQPATVDGLNRFAQQVGLLDGWVPYDRAVATQFSHLWSA
jgi:ABC-type nitrate/sulfonate/bicarbonate transport system substrate-binding protein